MTTEETSEGIKAFRVRDLLEFRMVLGKMVETPSLNLKDACIQVGKDKSLSTTRLKNVEGDVRRYLTSELDIAYLELSGKNLKVTDAVRSNANAIENSLSIVDQELQNITRLKLPSSRRGTVKVAAIISVINYLGPAIISSLHSREAGSPEVVGKAYRCPHLNLIYGDIDVHLRMLQNKGVDFVVGRNVDISLANCLDKYPLRMKGKERGVVFRYKKDGERTLAFPKLIDTLRSNDKEAFLGALGESPLIAPNVLTSDASDPFAVPMDELITELTRSSKQGWVITVATFRTVRQFVQMGIGVGFGHKPTHQSSTSAKSAGIHKIGATLACDPELPNVKLVYVPFESLGLKIAEVEPITFAIYYRRMKLNLGRGNIKNADMTQEVLDVANEFVAITEGLRGDFGYLRFEEGSLLHDYHFAGDSSFDKSPASKLELLPEEKMFGTPT